MISGEGSNSRLYKDGIGTLKLSGANTYQGFTAIDAGILEISNASGLGSFGGSETNISGDAALHIVGSQSLSDFQISDLLYLDSSETEGEALLRPGGKRFRNEDQEEKIGFF